MATGDTKVVLSHLEKQADGTAPVDFNSDTLAFMLIKAAHTPNYLGGDVFAASLTAQQVTTGTAYIDGGVTLSAIVSLTTSSSFAILKIGTISIDTDATGFATARWGVLYKRAASGTLAESPIISFTELTTDRNNTAGPLLIYWTGNKAIKWQVG